MRTFLRNSKVYSWTRKNGFYFRGYFIIDDILYDNDRAVEYLHSNLSEKNIETVLRKLNGVFDIIWEHKNFVLLAVDRVRSLPIFYAYTEGEIVVGDDVNKIVTVLPSIKINRTAEKEYIASALFVPGEKTLIEGLYQVEAGNYVIYDKEKKVIQRKTYFSASHDDFIEEYETLEKMFWNAYKAVARHLVQALKGRKAVVPLSGGADSRMILHMLKTENYQNVLCFTYGRKGNEESEISRLVAKEYGYEWVMIPYNGEMWKKIKASKQMKDYMEFAFAFTSTPHIQDFPAVMHLKEQGLISDDSVFVPGHSGDLIAGSHITHEYLENSMSRNTYLKTICEHFFSGVYSREVKQYMNDRFPIIDSGDMEGMASQVEWFNIQERQAKFIVNSVRVYEFFGYEWLIPLWDNELFEFWRRVPINLRFHRNLYFSITANRIPTTNDSITNKVKNVIEKMPVIRLIARRVKRGLDWWGSTLQYERSYNLAFYLKECLIEPPFSDSNTLLCKEMLLEWKNSIEFNKKST